ncbi:MAG: phage tail tape measure protein [Nitrospirae bacterium]|nr:phage tail tape measure protein [Nitrospirota bacterium]
MVGAGIAGNVVVGAGQNALGRVKEADDSAAAFEYKMTEIKSKLDETGDKLKSTMDSLKAGIVELSPRVGKNITELADGLNEIIDANIKPKDSLGVLGVSAKAAVAGATNTSTSAKFITEIMNAYKLPATDAGKVTNLVKSCILAI